MHDPKQLAISLIICTRNRAAGLDACLQYIKQLQFPESSEVVIVDNGSTDETGDVLLRFKNEMEIPVNIVQESTPGLANARNAGIAQARGEIIAFTDDDCYPEPEFLVQILKAFERSDVGFVGGRIMLHDPTDYPATINESMVPLTFKPGAFLRAGAVHGANLAFRAAVLRQVGGFDPLFGSGALFASEDVDTTARISRAGYVGLYDPTIVVSHHHGRKAKDVRKLYRSYSIGRGAYHAKLLLSDKAFLNAFSGFLGLPKRAIRRPRLFLWELQGMWEYGREYYKSRIPEETNKRLQH